MDVHYLRDVVKNSVVFKMSPTLQDKYMQAMEYHSFARTSKRRQTEREGVKDRRRCFTPRNKKVKKTKGIQCIFEKAKIKGRFGFFLLLLLKFF